MLGSLNRETKFYATGFVLVTACVGPPYTAELHIILSCGSIWSTWNITQLTPLRNLEHAWLLRIWDLQDYLCSQPGSPIHYWFDLEKMYWMPLSLNFSIFTWRRAKYQTHRVIEIIPWEKYMESTWHDTRDGLGAKYICYFSHIFTMFNTFNQENWAWTTGVSE